MPIPVERGYYIDNDTGGFYLRQNGLWVLKGYLDLTTPLGDLEVVASITSGATAAQCTLIVPDDDCLLIYAVSGYKTAAGSLGFNQPVNGGGNTDLVWTQRLIGTSDVSSHNAQAMWWTRNPTARSVNVAVSNTGGTALGRSGTLIAIKNANFDDGPFLQAAVVDNLENAVTAAAASTDRNIPQPPWLGQYMELAVGAWQATQTFVEADGFTTINDDATTNMGMASQEVVINNGFETKKSGFGTKTNFTVWTDIIIGKDQPLLDKALAIYQGSRMGAGTSATQSISNVLFGAAHPTRRLLVAIGGNRSAASALVINSVTFTPDGGSGIAASRVSPDGVQYAGQYLTGTNRVRMEFYQADVPDGVKGTVTVVYANTLVSNAHSIGLFALYNCEATPYDVALQRDVDPASVTIDTVDGGCLVAMAMTPPETWTGISEIGTQDNAALKMSFARDNAGLAETARALSADAAATPSGMIALSYAPIGYVPPPVKSLVYTGGGSIAGTGIDSSLTLTAQPIGDADASRYVIAAAALQSASSDPTATIGGVAATRHAIFRNTGTQKSMVAIYGALVPAGTTADFVISGSNIYGLGLGLWAAYNLDSTTPTDFYQNGTGSGSIDVEADGFAIAALCKRVSGAVSHTWTNITEQYDRNLTGIDTFAHDTGADTGILTSAATGLAISVTPATGLALSHVGVAFK
jgi:hypothetical protein